MTKESLTLENLVVKSECRCSGECPGCSDHQEPFAAPIKETLIKATTEVKNKVNILKTDARNEKFQKGALVVGSLALLYIILK